MKYLLHILLIGLILTSCQKDSKVEAEPSNTVQVNPQSKVSEELASLTKKEIIEKQNKEQQINTADIDMTQPKLVQKERKVQIQSNEITLGEETKPTVKKKVVTEFKPVAKKVETPKREAKIEESPSREINLSEIEMTQPTITEGISVTFHSMDMEQDYIDYIFQDKNRKFIKVRKLLDPKTKAINPILPSNLSVVSEETGKMDINEDKVGKPYLAIRNGKGLVMKVMDLSQTKISTKPGK